MRRLAMNPAALKTNLQDLLPGGILLVNTDEFTDSNFKKANIKSNPLDDGSLSGYRLFKLPITQLTLKSLEESKLPFKQRERCKNFYALGLMYWLYDRPLEATIKWIDEKFGNKPEIAEANLMALKAGFNYADTTEIFTTHYRVSKAQIRPGKYRNITGNGSHRYWFCHGRAINGAPAVLWQLSHHASVGRVARVVEAQEFRRQNIPGRRRNRGDRRSHRRGFHGSHRLDRHERARRLFEVRSDWFGRDDRIAARYY